MYQALLSRRYLFRKIIPLLAMMSVALCTAMVIIVLSVMGGFLEMVKDAGRKLIGDVAVQATITGFPHYEEMLSRIRDIPDVEAATAIIQGYGLVKLPDNDVVGVQIIGINGPQFDKVTDYRNTLYWRPLDEQEQTLLDPNDWRHPESDALADSPRDRLEILRSLEARGLNLGVEPNQDVTVLGIEIYRGNERLKHQSYDHFGPPMPGQDVTLSVIPVTRAGGFIEAESRILRVVNEFSAGQYDTDSQQLFVPFDVIQKMLHMDPAERRGAPILDANGDPVRDEFDNIIYDMEPVPGRATRIVVKAVEGVSPDQLKPQLVAVVDVMRETYAGELTFVGVLTWEEQIREFISVVKRETALVTTLFSIISLVSVFLVLSIFWTIVQQKTRDIGILRAVGASRPGIAWIFLRYGLVIGVLGSVLGAILAYSVVWNINPLHEFVGQVTGTYVWDPKAYYFNELPNEVNSVHALMIMTGGAIFAVVGALVPAIRAALVDPVASLRYE